MQINQPLWIIGLMSGTSADGVDAALLQTDGEHITQHGGGISVPYSDKTAVLIRKAMQEQYVAKGKKPLSDFAELTREITLVHVNAVKALLAEATVPREKVGVIGFHGQTIYHAPEDGITQQLGDAALLARETGVGVVADFRSNDVRLGGQGAPLAPLYHQALAASSAVETPLAVLNLGGVANLTFIGNGDASDQPDLDLSKETSLVTVRDNEDSKSESALSQRSGAYREGQQAEAGAKINILALDCGPASAMMDDVMQARTGKAFDEDGKLAASGKANQDIVNRYMSEVFFELPAPKSLDRNQFDIGLVQHLSNADALATLAAFTVSGVVRGVQQSPYQPKQVLVTGGGRHNGYLMQQLGQALSVPVKPVEAAGWNGDLLEAEAFAYLAARSVRGLPLSLPATTGVPQPVSGGVFYPV